MSLRQIGLALLSFMLFTPVFATQCPPAEKVMDCRGGECNLQRLSGWSAIIYFTDKGKSFAFQKERIDNTERGREINCFYTYLDPDTHRLMPPAIVLRSIVN
ncbi:MAG TPA: hypothetical protein VLJ15_03935 [Gammaproteobacteria bacterium]|nr:hypothetical protein [Gammaproteobacteria bacterium]